MIILACEIKLKIYDAWNLKDKRKVLKSIIERMKTFNISICELSNNNDINLATIGIVFVTNSNRHAESSMQKIINFLDNDNRIEILEIEREII